MTDSTTNVSDGIHLNANDVNIGGDVVGRDKIIQITNNIVQQAQIARERQPLRVLAVIASPVAGERETDPPPASLSGRAEWKALRAATKIAPLLLARLRPPPALALRTIGSPNDQGAFNSVVAHRWPLIDPAAVLFSQALYRELAAGRLLRAAI
jgi:hypothetical protein